MKLWVFSDTHRNLSLARRLLLDAKPGDLLVHGGDYYGDAITLAAEAGLKVVAVRGNCDWWGSGGPEEEVWEAAGVRILLTHGHQQRAKESWEQLRRRALQVGAGLVIFGHSHIPLNQSEDGIHLFNPGSISRPRAGKWGTYGVIFLQSGYIDGHIIQVSEQ